jgi:hypothetical protein
MSMKPLAIAVAVCGLTGETARLAPRGADVSLNGVMDAASAYVKNYEEELTFIVADETYTQQIRAQIPSEPKMPRTRTLKSEVSFVFAPSSREWMAIRDVIAVDGIPVEDRPDIHAQFRAIPAHRSVPCSRDAIPGSISAARFGISTNRL